MPWNWNSFQSQRTMAQCTNVRCQMFMLTTVTLLKVITALPFDVKSKENTSIYSCDALNSNANYRLLQIIWGIMEASLLRIYFKFNLLSVLKKKQVKPGFTNYQSQPKYSWALSKIEGKRKIGKTKDLWKRSEKQNNSENLEVSENLKFW